MLSGFELLNAFLNNIYYSHQHFLYFVVICTARCNEYAIFKLKKQRIWKD